MFPMARTDRSPPSKGTSTPETPWISAWDCGRGLGAAFVALCVQFGRERYGAARFRLSVAAFNERAIRTYKRAGFSVEREVTNRVFHNKFYIMTGAFAGSEGQFRRTDT